MKDRYLKYEAAGNQFVGQCTTIKYQLYKSYALSPAYFYSSYIGDPEQRLAMKWIIQDWLWARLPDTLQIDNQKIEVTMVCFSYLCYNYDHLHAHMWTSCALQASMFFQNIPEYIRVCAVTKDYWYSTEYTPRLVDIPPHVMLIA